jgi:hypothetical protein
MKAFTHEEFGGEVPVEGIVLDKKQESRNREICNKQDK